MGICPKVHTNRIWCLYAFYIAGASTKCGMNFLLTYAPVIQRAHRIRIIIFYYNHQNATILVLLYVERPKPPMDPTRIQFSIYACARISLGSRMIVHILYACSHIVKIFGCGFCIYIRDDPARRRRHIVNKLIKIKHYCLVIGLIIQWWAQSADSAD